MSSSRCAPFWLDSPSILVERAYDFFPFHEDARKCTSTALNSLTRFGIYLGILFSILNMNGAYLGFSFGIIILSIAAYYGMKQRGILREGFGGQTTIVSATLNHGPSMIPNLIGGKDVANQTVADVIGVTDRTLPTGPNPFMNVLLNEIKSNPGRPPAATVDNTAMAREYSDLFQTRMYNDPTDVFQHTQNQRTWVTQPSTSIPNDRDSFQNWLYRVPGRTCKEGNNSVCRTATEGTAVTWLSSP